jgi:LysM repeat protein
MNDKFTNDMNEIVDLLTQTAEGTNPNPHFTAELERTLTEVRNARSKPGRFHFTRKQTLTTLAWTASLIAFAFFMNWAISSVAPAPTSVPAANETSTPLPEETPTITDSQVTPIPDGTGYDWRDTKLYLSVPLPDAPTQANIYLLKGDEPATVEQARALAEQLGIQGQVYVSENPGTGGIEYFITDGKQSLSVTTSRFFTYTADMSKAINFLGGSNHPNAEATINEFLGAHGFNFPHKVTKGDLFGGYMVEPLSTDSIPMRYEFFSSRPMRVILDEDGQMLQIEANLMEYEPVGTQTYEIITAEEAFQKLMDDTVTAGKIESALSASMMETQQWIRDYPANETITIYGYASSVPALDPAQPAFIQIDGFTVTGNSSGMEALERNTFVEAIGQFIDENGIEKFNIESWQISGPIQDGLVGTLTSENGQIILQTEEGERLIVQPELPADVPIPFENVFIVGVRKDDTYNWTLIDNRMSMGGGGGGGGGQGFYKLNLSGTPVPFPPAAAAPSLGDGSYIVQEGDTLISIAETHGITVDELTQANGMTDSLIFVGQQLIIPNQPGNNEGYAYTVVTGDTCQSIASTFNISAEVLIATNNLPADCSTLTNGQVLTIPSDGGQSQPPEIGMRFENQRGIVTVNIIRKLDGNLFKEYSFATTIGNQSYYMRLTGEGLQELEQVHNRPVNIWATIEGVDTFGMMSASVERFEIPFPDLQFQILRGTQKNVTLEGQSVILFTTNDGVSYVQITPGGGADNGLIGVEGDEVLLEALAIPDESLGGYPALRIYSAAMAISPKNGEPIELTVTADQIYTYDENVESTETYVPPTLTIEKVELMYYVTNPHWQVDHLDGGPLYIQPVWRFYGRYDTGGEFETIVQALKEEFLLPELAPYIQGG